MQKDFITATPDSGGAGNNAITVTSQENTGTTARSTTIKVKGGGIERVITLSQSSAVITWNYYLSVIPTSLSFVVGGESKVVVVTSYRRRVVNGVETTTQENVSFTHSISGAGFSKNSAGTTITASENVAAARSGSVTYTQANSGKTVSVSLSQAAGVVGWNYYINVSPTSLSYSAIGGSQSVVINSYRVEVINGVESTTQQTMPYTRTISGTGFTANTNGTSITAVENTNTSSRSGSVTYTQDATGYNKSVSLSQAAATITWNYYISTSPTSWSFAALGQTRAVTVTSIRKRVVNGTETSTYEDISFTSTISGTGFSKNTLGTSVTASENTGTSARSGSVTYTQATSGNKTTVSLSQVSASISWNYYISTSPSSLSFVALGGSKGISISSIRKRVVNGYETSTQENVTFTHSISGAGFSKNAGGTSVTAVENTNTSSRSGSVTYTQATSNKTATVSLSQSAGVATWNYYITVTPTSLSFIGSGEAKTVSVTSIRKYVMNGNETSTQENVTFTHAISGTGFTKNGAGTTITAAENTNTSSRSGSVTYTQGISSKIVTVSMSQSAATISWNYYFSVTPTTLSLLNTGSTNTINVSSIRKKVVNGVETTTEEYVGWGFTSNRNWFTAVKETPVGESNPTRVRTTALANYDGGVRSGTISFSQDTSAKTANTSYSQPVAMNTLFYINAGYDSGYALFSSSSTPTGQAGSYFMVAISKGNGVVTSWSPVAGLTANNPTSPGNSSYLYAGNSVYIRRNLGGSSWSSAANVTLYNGETTISLLGV